MEEEWRDIKGYEEYYQVSNFGRVKSLDRYIEQTSKYGKIYNRFIKGKNMSFERDNGSGYKNILLSKGYRTKPESYYIHILVATHFVENPYNKPQVNHKDGNKENNIVSNLEWVTESENMYHAVKNNLIDYSKRNLQNQIYGEQCHSAKLTEALAMEIYKLSNSGKYSDSEIAKMYKISTTSVRHIRIKKTWKHIHNSYS